MNTIKTVIALTVIVMLSGVILTSDGRSSEWKEIATQDGEFSIFIPGQPKIFLESELSFNGGIKLTNQRVYVVCGAGIAFIVELYDASNPRRDVKALFDNRSLIQKFERDVSLNGFNGKQYRRTWKDTYSNIQYFTGRKRIYVIQVISRDEKNPAIPAFLSSLKLGGNAGGTGNAPADSVSLFPSSSPDNHIFLPDEVTKKAIPVWKPEPTYSAEGLKTNTKGTVLLQATILPTGEVGETLVLKRLGHGLDEKAIEAARSTLFIPAEKDRHVASQYIKLEYNFDTGR